MENKHEMILLFDVYGELLTEKQQSIFDKYYNEDLSLSEIAEEMGVTSQGIHDSIRKCRKLLVTYEEKIGYISKLTDINKMLNDIKSVEELKSVIDNI